jgi:hypothetical protein
MAPRVIVVVLLLLAASAGAQAPAARAESAGTSHFGAPALKVTTLRGQGAVMFGGRGGWGVSPTLTLGGGAYATMTEVDARDGEVPFASGPLDIKFECFGVELEYARHPSAPTHLTFASFFGGAAAHNAQDKSDDQFGETDFMLLWEPAAGVEKRLTESLHLHLAVSYRLVHGVEQAGLRASDLQTAAVTLTAKIGKFR